MFLFVLLLFPKAYGQSITARLLDADTGQEIQRLDSDQVHALVDSGELCPDDLADAADSIERIVLLLDVVRKNHPWYLAAVTRGVMWITGVMQHWRGTRKKAALATK